MYLSRLKGFSLLELVIVLSLSGLVLSIGGTMWRVFSQIHALYHAQQILTYDSMTLQQCLETDSRFAHSLQMGPAGSWLLQDRKRDTVAAYYRIDTFLVRKALARTDSFRFAGSVKVLADEAGLLLEDTVHHQPYQLLLWPVSQARTIPIKGDQSYVWK